MEATDTLALNWKVGGSVIPGAASAGKPLDEAVADPIVSPVAPISVASIRDVRIPKFEDVKSLVSPVTRV